MYILAMLIMLKIYQTRHPDVNATAHSAYMVMAIVIFLGVTGVVSSAVTVNCALTSTKLLISELAQPYPSLKLFIMCCLDSTRHGFQSSFECRSTSW